MCSTYQSDHEVIDLWVEVTEICGAYQANHSEVVFWTSGFVCRYVFG